jgi:hypothetical protein
MLVLAAFISPDPTVGQLSLLLAFQKACGLPPQTVACIK